MNLQQEAEALRQAGRAFKANLAALLVGQPDNDKINRINKQCFVVMFKDLGSDWTPEHHDFQLQHRALAEEIEKRPAETAAAFVITAVNTGNISTPSKNIRFHPKVIDNLRRRLEIPELPEQQRKRGIREGIKVERQNAFRLGPDKFYLEDVK